MIQTTLTICTILLFIALRLEKADAKVFNFEVKQKISSPDGYQRPCTFINNTFPGPEIRVQKGEEIVVNLRNSLGTKTTSIHWHGLEQRGTPFMDGAPLANQCGIEPYTSFQYKFSAGEQVGTYWYHSHSGSQYYDGLYGPLIIDDPEDPYQNDYDEDIIVFVQDWGHDFSDLVLAKLSSHIKPILKYNSILINGNGRYACKSSEGGGQFLKCTDNHAYTNFTVESGKTYRIRVINAGTKNELIFAIDSHPFTVIEVDGQYVKPQVGESIRVNLGQRYSLLVTANQTVDNYWMRAIFPIGGKEVDIIPDGLAAFRYVGAPIEDYPTTQPTYENEVNVDALKPLYPTIAQQPDITHTLNLTSIDLETYFFINNISFTPPSVPVYFNMLQKNNNYQTHVITLPANQVIRLVINNQNAVEHPIHLHGHFFQLLGTGAGIYKDSAQLNMINPLVRDTQVIPAEGWGVLQFVSDNPGAWFMHCHMDWHLEKGLALIFAEEASDHSLLPQLPPGFPSCGNYLPSV